MALLNLSIEYRTIDRAARGAALAGEQLIGNFTLATAGMTILQRAMREEVPVKKGTLRDSITAKGGGTRRGLWGVSYGQFVRDGTQPHIITATKARSLRWVGKDGATHFAKQVHHPGTKPNRFDQRTIARAEPALRVLMLENGRSVIRLMGTPV